MILISSHNRAKSRALGALTFFIVANAVKTLIFRHAIAEGGMNLNNFVFTAAVLSAIAIIAWPPLIIRLRGIVFWPAFALQALYFFVNEAYLDYYHAYLTISAAFAMAGEAAGVAGAGGIPIRPGHVVLILLDLPFALLAFRFRRSIATSLRSVKRAVKIVCVSGAALVLCLAGAYRASDDPFLYTIGRAVFRPNVAVNAYGLLPYQLGSYFQNERGRESLIAAMEPKGPTRVFPGNGALASIAIIQVESMGSDALQAKVGGQPLMPYLERLAGESIFFPYTLVYHKGGGTSDTEVALISSTETISNYPAGNLPLDYKNSFVKTLKKSGYSAIAYHGNGAAYFNRSDSIPAMGFDRFESVETMGLPSSGWGVPDSAVFDLVENEARGLEGPALLYVITMSSHGPYTNVPRYFTPPFDGKGLSEIEFRYCASMRYVDEQLERAVSNLMAAGVDYILIFGDHPDYYVEGRNRSWERSTVSVDGALMKFTPLFILTPDGAARKETERVASLLDLGPTILAASGAPGSIITYGENLLEAGSPRGPVVFGGREFDRKRLFHDIDAVSGEPLAR